MPKMVLNNILAKYGSTLTEIQHQYQHGLLSYPKEVFLQELMKFGVDFAYHSNRMEGNPLSYRDVAFLLHDREPITPANKPLWATLEIVNHQTVFEKLLYSKSIEFTLELIKAWHKALFCQTKPSIAGVIRGEKNQLNVKIHNSERICPEYSEVPRLMKRLIDWYNSKKDFLHPMILTALFHLRFETIHPFGDGNGRIGRLLLNFILYTSDYRLFNVEFTKRKEYYKALEQSNLKQDETYFLNWFFTSYCKFDYFSHYNS